MKEQDLFYLLALQRIEGVGDIWPKNCSRIVVQLKRLLRASASGYRRNW
jgi:hypothetical protein